MLTCRRADSTYNSFIDGLDSMEIQIDKRWKEVQEKEVRLCVVSKACAREKGTDQRATLPQKMMSQMQQNIIDSFKEFQSW